MNRTHHPPRNPETVPWHLLIQAKRSTGVKEWMWDISFKYWITGCTPLLECSQSTCIATFVNFKIQIKTALVPAWCLHANFFLTTKTGRWEGPQLYEVQNLQHYSWLCNNYCWGQRWILGQLYYISSFVVEHASYKFMVFVSRIRSLIPSSLQGKKKSYSKRYIMLVLLCMTMAVV